MNPRYNYFYFLVLIFALLFIGCKKDSLTTEEKSIAGIHVYDDTDIRSSLQVVAGKGVLLSSYTIMNSNSPRFMLTDNNGNHIWTKDFGVSIFSGMLAEDDGTFTIFDNMRMINIDVDGNILMDDPNFLSEINNYNILHVSLNNSGNYFIYGYFGAITPYYAFAYEITHSGVKIFKKILTTNTRFTGCQFTPDGGYLLLGNFFPGNNNTTKFFICKLNPLGVIDWIDYHAPPGLGVTPDKNFNYTHDIIETHDGNYFCFVGSTNVNVNNAARIYKVTPDGIFIDSVDVDFGRHNEFIGTDPEGVIYSNGNGYCAVKKADGTILAFLSIYYDLLPNTPITTGNQTFTVQFDSNLEIIHSGPVQNYYSDYFKSVCNNSDGKIAAFGYITSFGNVNKPIMLISE